MMLLTIYIPTFNRGRRLAKALESVFREIVNGGLVSKISVLVGDNASLDETPRVCEDAKMDARLYGIQFEYFRNDTNLGFSGNIAAGLSRVSSRWLMFLSDDDNLFSEALPKVCADLQAHQPSLSLYNFSQVPYDLSNPLIAGEDFSLQSADYSLLSSLILWPKMTGIVLKVAPISPRMQQISEICSFSRHFPHVIMSLFLFREEPGLFRSNTFLAKPDEDFLEHVNFVPYIDHYLAREIEIYRRLYDPSSPSLELLVPQITRTNILESSVDALIGFYRGSVRMTRTVKKKLFSNLFRTLLGKRESSDGLAYSRPSARFFIKVLALPFFIMIRIFLSRFLGKKPLLMEEGF